MATAKKLPSGSWRVRVYTHTDEDGKKHYKSFTAPTKKEAERQALTYQHDMIQQQNAEMTVKDAIERYITAKSGVLSPSTIRGYRQMQKIRYDDINDMQLCKIDSEKLQKWISSLSLLVSAKSVANIYGLFISAVGMFRSDVTFKVTLPKKVKPRKTSPSNAQIKQLYMAADGEMRLCLALAAFGSMRRGEICGLKYKDIKGSVIFVHADMVEDENNKFVYKEIPKTSDSVRFVHIPKEVAALIPIGEPEDFVITRTPNAVTHAFTRLRNRCGIDICFHDLRHYFASIGAVIGIPDTYMSDFGGWRATSGTMKEIYQNIIDDERDKYQKKMVNYFGRMTRSMTQKKRAP